MTTILEKGNVTVRFLITKERAEKKVSVGGNTNTTTQEMKPLEANREVTDYLRKGFKKKVA